MSRALVPKGGNDVIFTPPSLAKAIIDATGPSGRILEPCRGGGAFFDLLPGADWCELSEGRDFLTLAPPHKYDWVITNPPWSKFRPFLIKSMSVSNRVVFLVTLNHFFTKARIKDIDLAGFKFGRIWICDTPESFPSSGFQLGVVELVQKDFPTGIQWMGTIWQEASKRRSKNSSKVSD